MNHLFNVKFYFFYVMKSIRIKCLNRNDCESIKLSPDCYHLCCEDFVQDENTRKSYVLIHRYDETNHMSIIAFGDSYLDLLDVKYSHPRYGSSHHSFLICPNDNTLAFVQYVKDMSLINICKNVADFLAVGEYSMYKKSYFKASSWFEKAKNSASLGSDIIDNY